MSYFGVSNPELNSPFYGIGAAKRGRARAQRKRFTHTQMAGRNGGFADPREIMAYHNKGELSDGATIQALSLFGIGSAGARKMISDSRRSNQQAAMMGVRRQQASLRGFAGRVNQLGNPNNALIYDDSRGGSWRIEYTLESQMGASLKYRYVIKSLDTDFTLGSFIIIGGVQALQQLEESAKVRIENYVATIPIDDDEDEIIVDGGSDAYEGGDTNGDGGDATGNGFPDGVPSNAIEYNGYYYEVLESAFAIYSPEGEVLVVTSGYTSLNAATAGAIAWINSEIAGENPPRGNQTVQPTTETFTFQHTSVPDMPSTLSLIHISEPTRPY